MTAADNIQALTTTVERLTILGLDFCLAGVYNRAVYTLWPPSFLWYGRDVYARLRADVPLPYCYLWLPDE